MTPILLWAHIHRKVLILGKVSTFQIHLAERGGGGICNTHSNLIAFRRLCPSQFINSSTSEGSGCSLNYHLNFLRKLKGNSIPIPTRIQHKVPDLQETYFLSKGSLNELPKRAFLSPTTIPNTQFAIPSNHPPTTPVESIHTFLHCCPNS